MAVAPKFIKTNSTPLLFLTKIFFTTSPDESIPKSVIEIDLELDSI